MNAERMKLVLQQIADGTPRSQLHGQSLIALKRRGLIREEFVSDPNTRAMLDVKHYLTPKGSECLAALMLPSEEQA